MIALHAADVVTAVTAAARAGGKRPALASGGTTLTYAELERRAAAVAARLRTEGIGRGAVVGVHCERSIAAVVAALGVLRTGAAYLPLDPAQPAERLAFAIADAGATVVIGTGAAGALARGNLLEVAADGSLSGAASDPVPPAPLTADELAYVIYTSGSTGAPKGVEITHGGLAALVRWHLDAFAVGPHDRASHLAPVAFDAAVWEVWPYLAAGACVDIVPDEVVRDADALAEWLLAHAITIGFVPTPLAERLVRRPWPPAAPLRVLLTGADRLRWYPPPGLPFTLVNNYGPTECTVVATSAPVPPGGHEGPPPIGRPIAGTSVHVVDGDGVPVPDGEPGEIWIGGAGLARGYRNQPALTGGRFGPAPFGAPGERFYRTGDRGRFLPDGQLAFLGRIDDQIKLRGFRIEPGEIEAALCAEPAIDGAAVVAQPSEGGEPRLVAFVVARGDLPATDALRARLSARLPDYMLPAAFVTLDALPLTAHGKIDRAALRATPVPAAAEDTFVPPRTPTEARLAALIAPLLGVPRVGANDDFFALGGHSLLGTQLIARIQAEFGVALGLRTVFRATTVAALAAAVEQLR